LIIPSSDKPLVSWRIPRWLPFLAVLLLAALLVSAGFFVGQYYSLRHHLRVLKDELSVREAREREMRLIILSQQDEVKQLSKEVEELKAEMAEIEDMASHVRKLMGLPEPTPEPTASPGEGSGLLSPLKSVAMRTRTEPSEGEVKTGLVAESSLSVGELRSQIPLKKQELEKLEEELLRRIVLIEPKKRQTPEELEEQLKLLAAAPTRWPVDSRLITSEFGPRIFMGRREFHTGIDIGVWYRTPVRATKDGKVVFAGWHPRYGWVVKLKHEMGYTTIYAHNSYYLVEVGDEVKEGQVIALSGDSGYTNGPHLHYEIRLNGKPVDPMIYLSLGEEGE